jgi:hypothetical protein
VNGEQVVGAGKMGVRQQPWMQRRVKDGIEMHEQWQLWRRAFGGVGTHTDDGAEVAALEKDIGMVGGIAQGQGPCLDTALGTCIRDDGGAGSTDESGMG